MALAASLLAGQSVLQQVAPSAPDHRFDLYQHLGNLSPYFQPPNDPVTLRPGQPSACQVTKAFVVHRHGSRNPIPGEWSYLEHLSQYIEERLPELSHPRGRVPPEWVFLTRGWNNTLTVDNLSAVGRRQLWTHGRELRRQYPQLYTANLLAGGQERVVESAQWFARGYYGPHANTTATLEIIGENNSTLSWITPAYKCEAWSYEYGAKAVREYGNEYLPPIAARLNERLAKTYQNIDFTQDHVHGMLYACAYETAVMGIGSSNWCNVFTRDEILRHEYEYDLLMRGAFGYGLPQDMGPVLGSLLVSNLTTFFGQTTGANLSLNFGHDTTIDLGLTALGLAHDEDYHRSPSRHWRTAHQVPFAANMVWRLLECGSSQRVQLLLNGAQVDLSPAGCSSDEFGTCSWKSFLETEKVKACTEIQYDGPQWRAACSV